MQARMSDMAAEQGGLIQLICGHLHNLVWHVTLRQLHSQIKDLAICHLCLGL